MAQNYSEAVRWYRKAAEKGHPDAQNALGFRYLQGEGVGRDPAEALKWFSKAADQGNAEAENNLGWMYSNGTGVPRDLAKAASLFRHSAEKGHPDSMRALGDQYLRGEGVTRNPVEAHMWYSLAADYSVELPNIKTEAKSKLAEIEQSLSLEHLSQAEERKRDWQQQYHPPRERTTCTDRPQ